MLVRWLCRCYSVYMEVMTMETKDIIYELRLKKELAAGAGSCTYGGRSTRT